MGVYIIMPRLGNIKKVGSRQQKRIGKNVKLPLKHVRVRRLFFQECQAEIYRKWDWDKFGQFHICGHLDTAPQGITYV